MGKQCSKASHCHLRPRGHSHKKSRRPADGETCSQRTHPFSSATVVREKGAEGVPSACNSFTLL